MLLSGKPDRYLTRFMFCSAASHTKQTVTPPNEETEIRAGRREISFGTRQIWLQVEIPTFK